LKNLTIINFALFLCSCSAPHTAKTGPEATGFNIENQTNLRLIISHAQAELVSEFVFNADLDVISSRQVLNKAEPCIAPARMKRDNEFIYLSCSLSQSIHILDAKTLTLSKVIPTGNNTNPFGMGFDLSQQLFVSMFSSNELVHMDARKDLPAGELRIKQRFKIPSESLNTFADVKTAYPRPQDSAFLSEKVFTSLSNLDDNYKAAGEGMLLISNPQNIDDHEFRLSGGVNPVGLTPSRFKENLMYITHAGALNHDGIGYDGSGSITAWDSENLQQLWHRDLVGNAPLQMIEENASSGIVFDFKKGEVLKISLVDGKEIGNRRSLREERCSQTPLFMLSDMAVWGPYLIVLEYGSRCLMFLDRETFNPVKNIEIADGPSQFILE
jgi:hypothetical protein